MKSFSLVPHVLCLCSLFTAASAADLKAPAFFDPEDHVYHYLIPENSEDPQNNGKYFLWLPENCERVNGLFLAPKNMCEQTFLEFRETRSLCRELGLGIIFMVPSKTSPFVVNAFPEIYPDKGKSGQKIFNYKGGAVEFLQRILDTMAKTSGYPELAHAPLIYLSHSWAGAFASHAAYGMPERTICTLPLKSHLDPSVPFDPAAKPNLNGTPALLVDNQRGPNLTKSAGWDNWGFRQDRARQARTRPGFAEGNPVSRVIFPGVGHCEMPAPLMSLMVSYVGDICRLRLPSTPPTPGPVKLKPIDLTQGWLVDDRMDLPEAQCSPTASWSAYKGDRSRAIWYPNERLARTFESAFRSNFHGKQPQFLAFTPANPTQTITISGRLTVSPLADDQTFTVRAEPAASTTDPWYNGAPPLGRSSTPTTYHVNMGQLEQVGPDRFRAVLDRFGGGGVGRTIEADNLGDAKTQPAMRSIFVTMDPVAEGAAQKLSFPTLPDVKAGVINVPLRATTDSGLPVAYYVICGPAVVEGDHLRLTGIPPRASFPIEVKVAAYQWGRTGAQPVRNAGPIVQSFKINR